MCARGGNGGTYFWVDPASEIIGVHLSSAPMGSAPEIWVNSYRTDFFTDAVTAAVIEP